MHNFIKDLKNGDQIEDYFIIDGIQRRKKNDGGDYTSFSLKDKTDSMAGVFWFRCPDSINSGDVVNVSGSAKTGKGDKVEASVTNISKIENPDAEVLMDLVKSAPHLPEKMYDSIMNYIEKFVSNEEMKKLTVTILEENKEKLLSYPAAISFHHAEIGVLLHHTSDMLRSAYAIKQVYPYLNIDLLICGAALHDIGKIEENSRTTTGLLNGHTVDGELMGHLVIGAFKVKETGEKLGTDGEIVRMLMHMLLSHHGKLEYGSPVLPKFPEALVLNMIDDLDAKLFEMEEALGKTSVGETSEKVFAFDNTRLYRSALTGVDGFFDVKG